MQNLLTIFILYTQKYRGDQNQQVKLFDRKQQHSGADHAAELLSRGQILQ